MWEYIYDAVGVSTYFTRSVGLSGFDGLAIVNVYGGVLQQRWDSHAVYGRIFGGQDPSVNPSYWNFGLSAWEYPDPGSPNWEWRYLNEWHAGPDYYGARGINFLGYDGTVSADGMSWSSWDWMGTATGVFLTFRIVHPDPPGIVEWTAGATGFTVGPGGAARPDYLEGFELFYNDKYANAADPIKQFLSPGQASHMWVLHDDLFGHVTNYVNGITGIRLKFAGLVTFSGAVADAFSFEATPEQSSDSTFSAFVPPTAPTFVQDDSSGQTVVEITFADGEIKNRWLKTLFDGGQIAEAESVAFIIGNRVGDVDGNYRCLLNDAIAIRSKVSGTLVGISNAFDIDKNERVLLNEAIMARNAVSGVALPTLP